MKPILITLYICVGLFLCVRDVGRSDEHSKWTKIYFNQGLIFADPYEHMGMVIFVAVWLPVWILYHGYYIARFYLLSLK